MTSIIYYFRTCSHLTHENLTGQGLRVFTDNNGDFGAITLNSATPNEWIVTYRIGHYTG